MASTYTANLGIEKPGSGEQAGTWGTTTNTNFDIIDRAINGVLSLSLTGTTTTLTTTDGGLSDPLPAPTRSPSARMIKTRCIWLKTVLVKQLPSHKALVATLQLQMVKLRGCLQTALVLAHKCKSRPLTL